MNTKWGFYLMYGLLAAGSLLQPQSVGAIGGQFGLEFAIDAPWRLEPIPVRVGNHTYGPIPIVIAFHDAIFDDERGLIARKFVGQIHVGVLKEIRVVERSPQEGPIPTTVIPLTQLREIESKRWISTSQSEPPHVVCRPYLGEDCRSLHLINDTHEWHAMFWFKPKKPMVPGSNIQLEVTVVTEYSGDKREFTNFLVVHAGEAPLPRFGNDWLYGDFHYHSQMTDNEGESAYSYRNVVRVLGALGMDFVFATDHASGGTQVDGGVDVFRCGSSEGIKCTPNPNFKVCSIQKQPEPCRKFEGTEARDLNSARFAAAKLILYGADGANEAIAKDSDTGGIANLRARGLLPQVFMGEELDAWPEMSAEEQRLGLIRFGDGLQYKWPDSNGCIGKKGLDACRAIYSKPYAERDHRSFLVLDEQGIPIEETIEAELGGRHIPIFGTEFSLEGLAKVVNAFAPDGTKPFGSRQHIVYMPFNAAGGTPTVRDHRGFISSDTSKFGGGTRRLEEVAGEMQSKGVGFLAHPLVSRGPGGPGPDVVPYSQKALDRAWSSPAILGLQFWNENDRRFAGPTRLEPAVMFDHDRKYVYNLPWDRFRLTGQVSDPNWYWKRGTVLHGQQLYDELYHSAFTWDQYLRKGLDPLQTQGLTWLSKGEPRKWFMAGGSDSHGDFNYRRYGRPCNGQWCDAPVGDTAIGKPRNLVLVGSPQGAPAPALPAVKRHTNQQVIDSLRAGRFGVTDGPALRIAIDKNRNGKIDDADFQMGSTFNFYPGEHIPLLVEWQSSPEFGPVSQVDVYIGTPSNTFAPKGHGPILPRGSNRNPDFGAYQPDPSGVLQVKLMDNTVTNTDGNQGGRLVEGVSGDTPFHGLAKLYLGPNQFNLAKRDQALFYVRAFAKTNGLIMSNDKFLFQCPKLDLAGNSCSSRLAYSNPIWGRYQVSCPGTQPSLQNAQPGVLQFFKLSPSVDSDNNSVPDTCEREIPDPCPNAPAVGGPLGGRFGQVTPFGQGGQPAVAVDPNRTPASPQPAKSIPANSCQVVTALAVPLPGKIPITPEVFKFEGVLVPTQPSTPQPPKEVVPATPKTFKTLPFTIRKRGIEGEQQDSSTVEQPQTESGTSNEEAQPTAP
ncbi:MAG: hypothetical protein AB7T38_06340 [Nitrospirales bacterium]